MNPDEPGWVFQRVPVVPRLMGDVDRQCRWPMPWLYGVLTVPTVGWLGRLVSVFEYTIEIHKGGWVRGMFIPQLLDVPRTVYYSKYAVWATQSGCICTTTSYRNRVYTSKARCTPSSGLGCGWSAPNAAAWEACSGGGSPPAALVGGTGWSFVHRTNTCQYIMRNPADEIWSRRRRQMFVIVCLNCLCWKVKRIVCGWTGWSFRAPRCRDEWHADARRKPVRHQDKRPIRGCQWHNQGHCRGWVWAAAFLSSINLLITNHLHRESLWVRRQQHIGTKKSCHMFYHQKNGDVIIVSYVFNVIFNLI